MAGGMHRGRHGASLADRAMRSGIGQPSPPADQSGAAGAPRAPDTASTAGYATRRTCRASGPACWSSGANRRTAGTAESPTPSQARTARCWWRPGCQLTSSSKAESRPAGARQSRQASGWRRPVEAQVQARNVVPEGLRESRTDSQTGHDAARPRRIPRRDGSMTRVASASSSSPWKRGTTGRLLPPAFSRDPRRGRRAVDAWPYLAVPGLPGPRHK